MRFKFQSNDSNKRRYSTPSPIIVHISSRSKAGHINAMMMMMMMTTTMMMLITVVSQHSHALCFHFVFRFSFSLHDVTIYTVCQT